MLMKKKHIVILVVLGVFICVAVALTPSMVNDLVRVSIATNNGTPAYSINERDYGTNQTKLVSMLTRISKFSSGPIQIEVDSNTTFVVFASLVENLNQSCPKAKWYVTYKVGPRDVKVLYDARTVSAPHVEWISVYYEVEEPEHNKPNGE
jgi:hypothetical protein